MQSIMPNTIWSKVITCSSCSNHYYVVQSPECKHIPSNTPTRVMDTFLQLPSQISTASNSASYSESVDHTFKVLYSIPVALILSVPILLVIYPIAEDKIKSTDPKKRPKAFYQFWAAHAVILAMIIYIVTYNYDIVTIQVVLINTTTGTLIALYYAYAQCLKRGLKCCTCTSNSIFSIFTFVSMMLVEVAISLFIVLTPTLIFIFYLYPTHTLIRLPFIINSIIYTNSLLALLIYQCERSVKNMKNILAKRHNRRILCRKLCRSCLWFCRFHYRYHFQHESYDNTEFSWRGLYLFCSKYICQPIVTFCALTILAYFILVINDLFKLHQNHFSSKSDVETLILLVPTLMLLFGSWYRLDVFFDIEKKKSKEELLSDILKEIKRQRPLSIEMESPVNTPSDEEQTMNESHQNTENRASTDGTNANTVDTRVEITCTDENTPLVPPNPPASYSSVNN